MEQEKTQKIIYQISGMHCASCEIIIEKWILEINGVKSANASTSKGEVAIEYNGEKPSIEKLNSLFNKGGYVFSEKDNKKRRASPYSAIAVAAAIIAAFFALQKLGISGLVNINSQSSLLFFFLFGIMAGISTCMALTGGLILSMSKQWLGLYSEKNSFLEKLQPHIMFNTGRLISYLFLGALLGLIGSKIQITENITAAIVIAVSIFMLTIGLEMLGFKEVKIFQIRLPKSITRYMANESNFKGKYMPLALGALTFFLPCGFTITAQSLALISGSWISGGLIMFLFALGTLVPLIIIGISSIKLSKNPKTAYGFSRAAGILILFFALYNINSQFNLLGIASFNDINLSPASQTNNSSNQTENQVQVIKMTASASGYKPNYFTVKAGTPVRWEITDTGTSGCTNAVIAKGLFDGQIKLTPGKTSVKEFTPVKPGKYKFSCWMGMVTGTIEVVENNNG